MMLEEQPVDNPSTINLVENGPIICVDSPLPDTSTDQIVIEDEETLMEGFVTISQSPSTTPLNSPPQNFNAITLPKKLDKRSIDLSDLILDNPSKKSKDYTESVARGYLYLAKFREWKNNDGSYFPISVMNLCNYLRVKMLTNNIKSLDWNIGALGKYQKNVLNIQNWNDIRLHQDVRDLMNQIREEKMRVGNVKKINGNNANGENKIKKMKGKDSSVLSSYSGSSSPSPTPLSNDNRKKKRLARSKSAYDRVKSSSNDHEIIQNFGSASVAPFPFPQMQFSGVDLPYVIKYIPECEGTEISHTMLSVSGESSQTPIPEESMISLISTQDNVDVSSTSIEIGVQKEIIREDEEASGDDFVETDLPVAEELDEFSKRHAVK
ncbi:3568_t:CDS:2, partial [Racocetra fulgida]